MGELPIVPWSIFGVNSNYDLEDPDNPKYRDKLFT